MIFLCEMASEEGKRTALICHKLLLDVPNSSQEHEILQQFYNFSTHHAPIFTAANVLTVNLSTLFAVFGSLVTYVIVLIQFN